MVQDLAPVSLEHFYLLVSGRHLVSDSLLDEGNVLIELGHVVSSLLLLVVVQHEWFE